MRFSHSSTATVISNSPALVFLHLLKADLYRRREFLLGHPQHGAAQPETGADMDVDWVRLVGLAAAGPLRSSGSAHMVAERFK
jgi:hypothetical protein